MICEQCKTRGDRSEVRVVGHFPVLPMGAPVEYWDEDGNHHVHDLTMGGGPILRCTLGHEVPAEVKRPCPTCGEDWKKK